MTADDLKEFGITINAVMTYQYEEDFSPEAMLRCPQYDKRLVSDRIYYRLVLPLEQKSLMYELYIFIKNDTCMTIIIEFIFEIHFD